MNLPPRLPWKKETHIARTAIDFHRSRSSALAARDSGSLESARYWARDARMSYRTLVHLITGQNLPAHPVDRLHLSQ
jgi:hypothetical protein